MDENKSITYDDLIQTRNTQILKSIVPYLDVPTQKPLAMLIQLMEWKNATAAFSRQENSMAACSLPAGTKRRDAMLGAAGGSYSTAPFLDMPLNHKVFLAQFDAIKKIAANESCVIVGRCADYALADEPHCLNIFIRSNMDDRIKRISERLNVPENKAKDIIKKKDKERSSYYNYYTSKKWGDARSYDLCLNTSQISVEDSIELILKYRECMRSHNK